MAEREMPVPTERPTPGAKPPRCVVNFDDIPQELKDLDRWLVWKHEHDGERWTKVPYQSKHPNRNADSTRPNTWSTFNEAREAYENTTDVDGIGFALTNTDDIIGVDFDDKLDPNTGEINETTSRHLALLNSYTEISPSGAGFRVILRGTLANLKGRKHGPHEVYETARYVTITGNAIATDVTTIPNRQAELEQWHAEVFPQRATTTSPTTQPLDLTEQQILESISKSPRADVYERLWAGDDSDYNNDTSSADLAFCGFLHFHGANANQIDTIYRNSDRARDKWDEPRGDTTYGQGTISKALEGPQKTQAGRITLGEAPPAPKVDHGQPWANLDLDTSRWAINKNGVFTVKLRKVDGEWVEIIDYQSPIAGRPIWPAALAKDVTKQDQTHIQLAWLDAAGTIRTAWVSHSDANERSTLMNLDGAPVSYGRFAALTNWLADAIGWVSTTPKTVISRPYWVDGQFIMPGNPNHEHIGTPPRTSGTLEGWAAGIRTLAAAANQNAYPALIALGFSAISPAVALLNKRRPIVLYSHPSTSGKGTIINYALSIWEHHEDRTSPAGSTWRGVQDRATHTPDYPVMIDEAQQLLKRNPNILEDLFFFFGNGMSRVISTPEQIAKGGASRNGVAFFAAEENVLEARQGGSQNRVIIITHAPLPPNSPTLASHLERITRTHYGVAGPHITALINQDAHNLVDEIEQHAAQLRGAHNGLRGDDSTHLALLHRGLTYLAAVTNVTLPADTITTWLADAITSQRRDIIDRESACLRALLQTITSQQWVEPETDSFGRIRHEPTDRLIIHGEFVAFRGRETGDLAPLEVNPTARIVERVVHDHGFVNPAPDWVRRGWLVAPTGRHLGWKKNANGQLIGRFWRFTKEAFKAAGMTLDDSTEHGNSNGEEP